jgi:hypothetical protein
VVVEFDTNGGQNSTTRYLKGLADEFDLLKLNILRLAQYSCEPSDISCILQESALHVSVGGGPLVALNAYSRIHVDSSKGATSDPDRLDGAVVVLIPTYVTWQEWWKQSKKLTETWIQLMCKGRDDEELPSLT